MLYEIASYRTQAPESSATRTGRFARASVGSFRRRTVAGRNLLRRGLLCRRAFSADLELVAEPVATRTIDDLHGFEPRFREERRRESQACTSRSGSRRRTPGRRTSRAGNRRTASARRPSRGPSPRRPARRPRVVRRDEGDRASAEARHAVAPRSGNARRGATSRSLRPFRARTEACGRLPPRRRRRVRVHRR